MSGRRRKLEMACWHEFYTYTAGSWRDSPVNWWHRFLCKYFGHKWRNCFKHNLSQCDRCDYRVEWSEPK